MNWTLALPEITLALAALALLVGGVIPRRDTTFPVSLGAIGALLLAAVLTLGQPDGVAFNGQYASDAFTRFAKVLVLLGSAAALVLSLDWNAREGLARFEHPILILTAALGSAVMLSSGDLMSLYLGLELLSLSQYVLAASNRDSARSAEAGLKYFVLGALASGLLLYGASLVYGFAGSTGFAHVAAALSAGPQPPGLVVGLVFVVAALCFKVAAFPFHMWTPDVYEGAPTPVVAFFATGPAIAAVALLTRVVAGPFADLAGQWTQVLWFASLGSMVLGSVAAIGQRNLKRLMAYSSIGNVGYSIMGLAVGSEAGLRGTLIYLAIYLAMTLGAFAVIVALRRGGRALEGVDDLAGLGRTDPAMALGMAVFMFSLAGIPPLAGFFSKLYVFLAAVRGEFWTLAVVGVLASVVSAYYYLRIVKVMYFDAPPAVATDPRPVGLSVVLAGTGLFTALFFLAPAPLVAAAGNAVAALLR